MMKKLKLIWRKRERKVTDRSNECKVESVKASALPTAKNKHVPFEFWDEHIW